MRQHSQRAVKSPKRKRFLDQLAGGDRRSIGRSNEVAARVLRNPPLFGTLFQGLKSDDPLIRMRSADAIEKITLNRPQWLKPHKKELLDIAVSTDEQEIRWHVAQMLPRLALTAAERRKAVSTLMRYLDDPSSIVKTFTLQALVELSVNRTKLRDTVVGLVRRAAETGTPAMKSRARRLLRQLQAKPSFAGRPA